MPRDVDGMVHATANRHGRSTSRVVIADDDAITRMVVKALLEREGFEVVAARDGREAIELVASVQPDLLLVDLNMPEMDGDDVVQVLRGNPSSAPIPIIVLTGERDPGIERRVLGMGADDYMLKPFAPNDLIARVDAALRRFNVAA